MCMYKQEKIYTETYFIKLIENINKGTCWMIAMVIENSTKHAKNKPSYSLNGLDEVETTQNFTYVQDDVQLYFRQRRRTN